MKTVLALIVAATLSLSSVAFAADTVVPQATPPAPAVHNASAKTMHHKKHKTERNKNTHKTAPKQEAQAAKTP